MIRRARLALLAAVVVSIVVIVTELPLSALLRERSAVARSAGELAALRRTDAALAQQVAELRRPSTVARLAHEDYGLVSPGQAYEAVLPSPGESRTGSDPLADSPLAHSLLVPSDATIAAPATAASGRVDPSRSFWSKLADRLEFWKAAS
ncbi:MAG: hypothetical protein M0Z69_05345 [Actinomycetota bacterium]|nr:hypothetical protein [Actinomycetota bacterium]